MTLRELSTFAPNRQDLPYNLRVNKRNKTLATRRKSSKAKKLTEPVSFDTKDISTAIDSITVSAEKVSVMFSSQEKVYDYTFTGNLSELVSELEKFVKEQHLSLGRYFNNLVKDGKLTQMK